MKNLKYYGGNIYPLYLKTLTGKTIVLEDINKNITIKQLKKKVGKKMNIMPKYIRLVWAGKQLGDNNLNNRKNDLRLNGNYGYDFGQDKGIHIIIDNKRMNDDKERLKSRQSLAFMSALLEERAPTNEIDDLSNIGSIMANYMKHNPGVLERSDYQDYGYDRTGYDLDGYDMDGYDRESYDPDGYDREGFNPEGYDREGFNIENYNEMANYLNAIQGGTNRKKKKKKKKMTGPKEGEYEVYRISPEVGKCYMTAERSRKEGRFPNERYYTNVKPRYVGEFKNRIRGGYGDNSSTTDYFHNDMTNKEEQVIYSYEGTTCFLEVDCYELLKRQKMLAFMSALLKERAPTNDLEDLSHIGESIMTNIKPEYRMTGPTGVGGGKISQNTYQKLLKNKNNLTKKNRKLLNKTLNKKYCSCVKKVRKTLNKRQRGAEYPICTKSIYNNRNIVPPKNKNKNCK